MKTETYRFKTKVVTLGAASLLLVSIAVVAVASVSGVKTQSGSRTGWVVQANSTLGARTGTPPSSPPQSTALPDPWLAFVTGVNPGTGIDFVSQLDGWRVDGRQNSPYEFGLLAAGPDGKSAMWPGNSVSSTTDGGDSWSTIVSLPNGVWGVDQLNQNIGWVVGVTEIVAPANGGATWHSVNEPQGTPLVRVALANSTSAVGVSVHGGVFATNDGGATWQALPSPTDVSAICTSASGSGFAVNASGAVFQSTDNGTTWSQMYQVAIPSGAVGSPWSDISCSPGGSASVISQYSTATGGASYVDSEGGGSSSTWTTVASSDLPTGQNQGAIESAGGQLLGAAIETNDSVAFVWAPPAGGVLEATVRSTTAATESTSSINLPASDPTLDNAFFEGLANSGNDIWTMFIHVVASSHLLQTCVASSSDGGVSWDIAECDQPISPSAPRTTIQPLQ